MILLILKDEILRYSQNDKCTTCHADPFAFCHSEGAERLKNLAQGRLRKASLILDNIGYFLNNK